MERFLKPSEERTPAPSKRRGRQALAVLKVTSGCSTRIHRQHGLVRQHYFIVLAEPIETISKHSAIGADLPDLEIVPFTHAFRQTEGTRYKVRAVASRTIEGELSLTPCLAAGNRD